MKRFLQNTTILLICTLALVWTWDAYVYYDKSYENDVPGAEVYEAIRCAHSRHFSRKLFIGDSVGRQVYGTGLYSDSVYSLACNQAITMAGHFFLLKTFLTINADSLPEQIILSYDQTSLANDLDCYSYQYLLKPFMRTEYWNMFSSDFKKRIITTIPWWWTSRMPVIRTNGFSPDYSVQPRHFEMLSPITVQYLDSIVSLTDSLNISLTVLSNPVRESRFETIANYYQAALQAGECPVLFDEWFKSIHVAPDSCFRDHIHFKAEYIPSNPYGL